MKKGSRILEQQQHRHPDPGEELQMRLALSQYKDSNYQALILGFPQKGESPKTKNPF